MNRIFKNKVTVIATILTVAVIATLVSLFIFSQSQEDVEAAEWFDESWLYRRSFDVGNNTTEETDVYISATLDTSTASKFQSDCGDLRFTDASGNLLDYYIASGCGTASTITHIEFSTLPTATSTVYYYYGNSSVANGFVASDFVTEASNYYVGSTTAEEQGPGPVIYWNFDKGYGTTVNDNASSGYDGAITAAVWMNESECKFYKCLYFDGSGDYVDATDFSNVPAYSKGTLSFWVKLNRWASIDNLLGLQTAATNNDAFRLEYTASGQLRWIVGNSSGSYSSIFSPIPITLNKWHFITLTWDSTANTATMYVDNESSQGSVTTWPTTYTGFRVGTAYAGRYAQGFIDEVKLYNYNRSADQIKQDYNKGASVYFGSTIDNGLSDNLIGYWKMDEIASSTCVTANYDSCDSSGNNNDGNWSFDAFATTTAKYGKAVDMDGTGDFILVDSSSSLDSYTDSLSMAGWFYLDTLSTTKYFFDKQNNFYFRVSSTGAITLYLFGVDNPTTLTTASGVVTTGDWFHVAFTYDGARRRIYVNGDIQAEDNKSGSVSSGGGLYIASQAAGQNPIDGRVDEIRFYNSGLSPTEIRRLYEWAPGPIAHYSMNVRSGTNVYDIASNSNNLTFGVGMDATTDWVIGKYGGGLLFDDTGGQVAKSSGFPDISSAYTVSAWVKMNNDSNNSAYYVSFSNNIRMSSYNAGNFDCAVNDGGWNSLSSGVTIPKGEWHYLTCTYDGATRKIYYDGVLKNSVAYTNGVSNSAIQLGWGDSSAGLGGVMDDVKVYDYARTPQQILEDMNAGKKNNPIAYWSFDEAQGTTAYNYGVAKQVADSSHDAVITGATWKQGNECKVGNCLNFDGNDWVEDTAGFNLSGNNQVSFSFWVNGTWDFATGDSTGYQSILVQQLDWSYLIGLTQQSAGRLSMTHRNGGTLDRNIISYSMEKYKNKWVHVVGIYDAGNYKLYINGELVAEAEGSYKTISSSLDGIGFGIANNTYANRYFAQSKIDEVKVYNYAITQEEIDQNYNQGRQIVLSKSAQEIQGISNGLVGWWKMDETTWSGVAGEVIDSSGAGNHGTSTNAVSTSTAKFGRAGYFDGVGDYIEIPDTDNSVTSANSSRTVSLWFRADTTGSQKALISAGDTAKDVTPLWLMTQRASNVLSVYHGDSYLEGSSTLNSGVWYYATYTYDSDSNIVVLYLNGREEYRGVVPDANNTSSSIFIGDGYNAEFSGEIDDVKIYNYARTPEQVMRDYVEGPPPIGYWKMDERTGSVTVDNSGIGNNGSITGAVWKSSADCKYGSCLYFDGNDYIDVGTVASNGKITFTAWFKSNYQDRQGLIDFVGSNSIRGMFNFDHAGNERPLLYLNTSNYVYFDASAANYLDDEWHFLTLYIPGSNQTDTAGVVLTIDGNVIPVYATSSTDEQLTWDNFYIGRGYNNDNWQGMIDGVKIYNYELTQRQIMQEYNNGKPVGYWKFDKGEGGIAYDYSGNGNNGTIYPGTAGVNTATSTMWSNGSSGKINSSIDFDGTDDKIKIGDNTDLQIKDELTVCAWVYSSAVSDNSGIFEKTVGDAVNSSYLLFGNNSVYSFRVDMAGLQTVNSVTTLAELQNTWAHICGSYNKNDNGRLSIYINGNEDNYSNIPANSIDTGSGSSYIGSLAGDIYPFDGQIDEVKVWNYALTSEDIKREYNGGFGVYFK